MYILSQDGENLVNLDAVFSLRVVVDEDYINTNCRCYVYADRQLKKLADEYSANNDMVKNEEHFNLDRAFYKVVAHNIDSVGRADGKVFDSSSECTLWSEEYRRLEVYPYGDSKCTPKIIGETKSREEILDEARAILADIAQEAASGEEFYDLRDEVTRIRAKLAEKRKV